MFPTDVMNSDKGDKNIDNTPEIAQVLKLDLTKAKEDTLFQLQKLEEDRINSIHDQEV